MSIIFTAAADGALTAHRDTCKRIGDRDAFDLEDIVKSDPGKLTTAKKGTCCRPTDTMMSEVEQAGWAALEAAANSAATAEDDPAEEDEDPEPEEDEAEAELDAAEDEDEDEDLIGEPAEDIIGDVQQNDDGITAEDEDLIGVGVTNAPARKPGDTKTKAQGKTAGKVAAARTETRELNGAEALAKVAAYLEIDLGKKPAFPGFGRAFKTAAKQSIYINSKGNADARAATSEQADEWAMLDHVERRSGNYVRVNLSAI